MPTQNQIREEITRRIITVMEMGTMPWRQPWRVSPNAGRPANVASKRCYSGVNPLLLQLAAMQHGFQSRWWATYQQWATLGCQVQRRPDNLEPGQWGTKIVFASKVKKAVENAETGEEEKEEFFLLKHYVVFNADQVSGAEKFQVIEDQEPGNSEPDFAPAEELILATGATIKHGGERAFYDPVGDFIQLPYRARFQTLGAFYETALHELAHWSEVRLKHDRQKHGYGMMELVAEIAACFMASEIGVPNGEGLESHASYVGQWLERMKADASYIFRAAKMASATCDYLLSFVREPEVVEVG